MSASNKISAIVLAAGSGTRMKSQLSKVLHPVAGRPLFHYSVLAAARVGAEEVIIVTSPSNREAIAATLEDLRLEHGHGIPELQLALQQQALGSGDAVRAALPLISGERVLIINGDTPLITEAELRPLLEALDVSGMELAVATCSLPNPSGYGRVLRAAGTLGQPGRILGIKEQRDLTSEDEREIREVNAGIYAATASFLQQWLPQLTTNNAQQEYYITDLVASAALASAVVGVDGPAQQLEGINDRVQLATLEQRLFRRIADCHRLRGVTIRGDAEIDDTVVIGEDTVVASAVSLRGRSVIGARCRIDQGSVVSDSNVEDDVNIKPYSMITESRVGTGAQIGPFAHLRPRSVLDENVHVGNFVETKATRLRKGAKANHLAYLGDGDIGEGANIGAGTIFCNYDGFSKAMTRIGKGAFIGSDSQLVAPVSVGDGAYVATGTTVTEDVPAEALAISRPKQTNKPGYASTLRAKLRMRAASKRQPH